MKNTPLQSHILNTLARELDPELLLTSLVEWMDDDALAAFVKYLPKEIEVFDLPPAPKPLPPLSPV